MSLSLLLLHRKLAARMPFKCESVWAVSHSGSGRPVVSDQEKKREKKATLLLSTKSAKERERETIFKGHLEYVFISRK